MVATFAVEKRLDLINKLLLSEKIDLHALHTVSRLEGGFIDNRTRARVWPKILAVNRYSVADFRTYIDPHRDDTQIRCDIERSLWNFDKGRGWDEQFRDRRRNALSNIITAVLCRNPTLHYYQGFHDLASVFLLVLDDDLLAFALTEVVSTSFFQDYMTPDFEIVSKTMHLIMVLLKASDSKLYNHLNAAGVEPFFATSWLITWFAHDIKKINEIARVFDALLCSHPLFAVYLCAATVIKLRSEVLACECDFASLHNLLVHSPERGLPFEDMLTIADDMMTSIPPSKLFQLADDETKSLIQRGLVGWFRQPEHVTRYVESDWILLENLKLQALSPLHTKRSPIGNNYTLKDILSFNRIDGRAVSATEKSKIVDNIIKSRYQWNWGWKRSFHKPLYLTYESDNLICENKDDNKRSSVRNTYSVPFGAAATATAAVLVAMTVNYCLSLR